MLYTLTMFQMVMVWESEMRFVWRGVRNMYGIIFDLYKWIRIAWEDSAEDLCG